MKKLFYLLITILLFVTACEKKDEGVMAPEMPNPYPDLEKAIFNVQTGQGVLTHIEIEKWATTLEVVANQPVGTLSNDIASDPYYIWGHRYQVFIRDESGKSIWIGWGTVKPYNYICKDSLYQTQVYLQP